MRYFEVVLQSAEDLDQVASVLKAREIWFANTENPCVLRVGQFLPKVLVDQV